MKKKLVFIGDSIVNGFPYSRSKSFTGVMRKVLQSSDSNVYRILKTNNSEFTVVNKGMNGQISSDVLMRFGPDALDLDADFIFIMTGTNDFIYRDNTPEGVFHNLERMAAMAEEKSEKPMVIYLTPLFVDAKKASRMWLAGCGINYERVNEEIYKFADMIRSCGHTYVDLNQRYADFAEYVDGLHPTETGYEFIASAILDWMIEQELYQ